MERRCCSRPPEADTEPQLRRLAQVELHRCHPTTDVPSKRCHNDEARRRAPLRLWDMEQPAKDVQAERQRLCRSDDVVAVAAMPDVHLASEV